MPNSLRALRERRAAAVAAMREITNAPAANGNDLSDEQAARFNELRANVTGIDAQIERAEFVADAERRMQGERVAGSGDANLDGEIRDRYSLARAIRLQMPDTQERGGFEAEVSAELARRSGRTPGGILVPATVFERRVMTTTAPVGGPGSNLIQTDVRGDQYIDILRAALRIRQLGATVLTGLVGNVAIPRTKASASAGWVAENAAISGSDVQVDQATLAPKHAGALTEFSRNLLMQTSPDVEQLLRQDFAAVLAQAVDSAAIKGGGSNEPVGILSTSGIGSVAIGTNGGALTWASVVDLIAAVDDANGIGAAPGFLTNSKVVKSARKTAKVSSTDSVMIMDGPNALAGYQLASTSLVPSNGTKGSGTNLSSLIFGDFSQLVVGYWSEFDLLVNPYEATAYSKGNVQVRGMVTCDVALRHAAAFAAITDLTTP